jgi:hypothetical protein
MIEFGAGSMAVAMKSIQEIYELHIRPLPARERLRLVEMIERDVASENEPTQPARSLLELEGLGAELWQGIDAQEYVNSLRDEWDHRA